LGPEIGPSTPFLLPANQHHLFFPFLFGWVVSLFFLSVTGLIFFYLLEGEGSRDFPNDFWRMSFVVGWFFHFLAVWFFLFFPAPFFTSWVSPARPPSLFSPLFVLPPFSFLSLPANHFLLHFFFLFPLISILSGEKTGPALAPPITPILNGYFFFALSPLGVVLFSPFEIGNRRM